MTNEAKEKTVYIGARIPEALSASVDQLAPYYKGGRSELVRRCVAIGLQVVAKQHLDDYPIAQKEMA
jgi:hypothetical protein